MLTKPFWAISRQPTSTLQEDEGKEDDETRWAKSRVLKYLRSRAYQLVLLENERMNTRTSPPLGMRFGELRT